MAKIGLKYPVAAKYASGSYSGGKVLGKAISASAKISYSEAKLYADDVLAESVKEFQGGSLTLGLDEMEDDTEVLLFGHTKTTGSDGKADELVANAEDMGAYVGVGFYGTRIKDHVRSYKAIWYTKVQFKDPEESQNTRGENTTFSTYSIEGDLLRDDRGDWRKSAVFTTEAAAVAWLNEKAGIST